MSLSVLHLMIRVVEIDGGKLRPLSRSRRCQRSDGVIHLPLQSRGGVGLREVASNRCHGKRMVVVGEVACMRGLGDQLQDFRGGIL